MGNNSGGIGIGTLTIIFAILAYFVYGKSISAGLGMILLSFVSGVVVCASFIPVVGVFFTYYINSTYVYPGVMNFTGLYPTWVTDVQFWFHVIAGIFITIWATCKAILVVCRVILELLK